VWGFANDDHHAAGDIALGWNMVWAADRSILSVTDALRNGSFYASTGVRITNITVDGMTIRIETENARKIAALRNTASRFAVTDSTTLEVTVPDDAQYVRFECWGDGEANAWTHPFFVITD